MGPARGDGDHVIEIAREVGLARCIQTPCNDVASGIQCQAMPAARCHRYDVSCRGGGDIGLSVTVVAKGFQGAIGTQRERKIIPGGNGRHDGAAVGQIGRDILLPVAIVAPHGQSSSR